MVASREMVPSRAMVLSRAIVPSRAGQLQQKYHCPAYDNCHQKFWLVRGRVVKNDIKIINIAQMMV